MNIKSDLIKQNERIIYLVMIVALVIALITISTCNKRTVDKNYFVESQVDALNGDMQELEAKLDEKDTALKAKTQEIVAKKTEIQNLIKRGEINATEAERKIKELRTELSGVNEELIIQKHVAFTNNDSLNTIILALRTDKNDLQSEVANLKDELSKKIEAVKPMVIESKKDEIPVITTFETMLSPRKGFYLNCILKHPTPKDETFTVLIYDNKNKLISPQNGIYTFTIPKGKGDFHDTSDKYKKGTFRVGSTYQIAIRDANGLEMARTKYTVHLVQNVPD